MTGTRFPQTGDVSRKPIALGTYMAEQTASDTYDLSAGWSAYPEKRDGKGQKGRKMRKGIHKVQKLQCIKLPALNNNNIHALLDEEEPEPERELAEDFWATPREEKMYQRKRVEEERIDRAVARVSRPKVRGPLEECMRRPDDLTLIQQLTRPRTGSRLAVEIPRLGVATPRAVEHSQIPKLPRVGAAAKKHSDHHDLFQYTRERAGEPLPQLTPRIKQKQRRTIMKSAVGEVCPKASDVYVEVLPEDPVAEFLASSEAENKAAVNTKKAVKFGDETAVGKLVSMKTMSISDFHAGDAVSPQLSAKEQLEAEAKERENTSPRRLNRSGTEDIDRMRSDRSFASRKSAANSLANKDITSDVRENCENMWLFIFGICINEDESVFYRSYGTPEELFTLLKAWGQMDRASDGRVNFEDFTLYVEHSVLTAQAELHASSHDPTHGMLKEKFKALADKVSGCFLAKKSSIQIDDIMKILWPAATVQDLKDMHRWTDGITGVLKELRVTTPPMLPGGELAELTAVFDFFDADGSGTISFEELVSSGLLDKETALRYMKEFDADGSGVLSRAEFYEMMCPNSYRAFEGARRASDLHGQRIIFEEVMGGWRMGGPNGETKSIYDVMPKVKRERKSIDLSQSSNQTNADQTSLEKDT